MKESTRAGHKLAVRGLEGDLEHFNGLYVLVPFLSNDGVPVWKTTVASPDDPEEHESFYIYRDADEHWWAMGYEEDMEGNSGDVTSEETGQDWPVNLTYGGDYGAPTVQWMQ